MVEHFGDGGEDFGCRTDGVSVDLAQQVFAREAGKLTWQQLTVWKSILNGQERSVMA